MFELNVTLCATVFKHMCFYINRRGLFWRAGWGGAYQQGRVTAMERHLFLLLTSGALQHLHLCFDISAISDIMLNLRPGRNLSTFLSAGLSVTPL